MHLEELLPGIFHVSFKKQKKLASTFLRFQEHFESPKFRGEIFSLDEYKKWYIKHSKKGKKKGKFTYYKDFIGFNFPSEILEPFYEGWFNPLSKREQKILDLFAGIRKKRFYIIGTSEDRAKKEDALRHEIAHGLFYMNPQYKEDVHYVLARVPEKEKKKIARFFRKDRVYHESAWEDEMHAWLMCDYDFGSLEAEGINLSSLLDIHQDLNLVFESYQ